MNTAFALTGSCVAACAFSRLIKQKLSMDLVLNATMAGGCAIGTSSDLVTNAGAAITIGALGGVASAIAFTWLGSFLLNKINLHDAAGAHSLHGLPGVIGGIVGAVAASFADSTFGNDETLLRTFEAIADDGRTTTEQGWYQLAALGCTLAISIVGGLISGFLSSLFEKVDSMFDDQEHFEGAHYDYLEKIKLEKCAEAKFDTEFRVHTEVELKNVAPESARNILN